MVLVVASIDFGTTFSGWAYSFTHEHEKDPTDVKAKNWHADQFISAKGNNWTIHNEDETGKQLKALTVFSLTIKYLQDDLVAALNLKMVGGINRKDIHWVLTVPAIWNDSAKQFMRMAAREAGTEMGHLNLALEPEAASIFCRHSKITKTQDFEDAISVNVSTFKPGTRYLVCDAGGGTVDVTVRELTSDMKLKEIEKASGGAWGGTKVDDAFEKFVDVISGCSVMKRLKERNMEDYLDIMRTFEIKKRECKKSSTGKVVIRIPSGLCDIVVKSTQQTLQEQIEYSSYKGKVRVDSDKLKCEANVIAALFTEPVHCIIGHLSTLLSIYHDNPINHIVMVGGFSESPLLPEAVRTAFPGKHVTVPQEAGLAVMKGAVMFGHNKRQIVSRIARFTYGIDDCCHFNPAIHPAEKIIQEGSRKGKVKNCFSKLVEIGQSLPSEQAAGTGSYRPKKDHSSYIARVYATKNKNPVFVEDSGCFMIGSFHVNCKDKNGKISSTVLKMYFGGTEIDVKASLKTTGEEIVATFDLPD